jgi:hypothetical protein
MAAECAGVGLLQAVPKSYEMQVLFFVSRCTATQMDLASVMHLSVELK